MEPSSYRMASPITRLAAGAGVAERDPCDLAGVGGGSGFWSDSMEPAGRRGSVCFVGVPAEVLRREEVAT